MNPKIFHKRHRYPIDMQAAELFTVLVD